MREGERYNSYHSSAEYRRVDVAVELGHYLEVSVIDRTKFRSSFQDHSLTPLNGRLSL